MTAEIITSGWNDLKAPPGWMRRWTRPVLLLVLMLAGVRAPAQAQATRLPSEGTRLREQFLHERWTVQDGLPVNHANELYQTPDGYLWLATFDGLVRFDGVRFTVFNAGNTEGLPSSRITGIQPGPGTSFWLDTGPEGLVRVEHGRFEPVGIGRSPNLLSGVYPDGDSLTWIATQRGFYRYRTGHLEPFAEDALGDLWISDVLRDRRGTLWVATFNGGVWRFEDGRPVHTPLGLKQAATLFEDADGTLWIGGSGIARYRNGRWQPFTPPDAPWTRPAWQPKYNVWAFHREPGGPLWLATPLGLYHTEPTPEGDVPLTPLATGDATLSQAYRRNNYAVCPDRSLWLKQQATLYFEGQPVATMDSRITDLLCDREGNLWVTTRNDGLYRFYRSQLRTYGEAEGLGFRNVYHIYEDRSGDLWFTGPGGTVSRLRDGHFRHFTQGTHFSTGNPPRVGSNQAVYEDRAGNLWLGFQVCPAARRSADGTCSRFTWAEGAPRDGDVYAILQTRTGALWFGVAAGPHAGLYRLRDGQWTRFTTDDGLPDSHVRYLLETRDGSHLYVATVGGGIAYLNLHDATGPQRARFTPLTTRDGLSSNHVRALYEDADGIIWIGTEDGGLNCLDPPTGAITTIRQADGLYYDGIHQILEDAWGRLWMSTNRGLFWVRRAELNAFARGEIDHVQSVAYTERDGMRSREANGGRQESALEASDGRLWFATQDGAVVVDPAEIVPNPLPVPVVIEQVTARGKAVPVHDTAHVELAANRRSFTIAYTAPSFTAPGRIRFRYRLKGFDEDWVRTGRRREAVYTKVPPGDYVFHVIASNGDGVWNEEGATLALTVAPFFYETWWFYALCALVGSVLLVAGYRVRTRQHRRRARTLERKVDERTEALRAEKRKTEAQAQRLVEMDRLKSRFFTNVSHEFRTPLTLTIGPLEDLQADEAVAARPPARKKIDLALRNSRRLLRLIGQLLDVAKLETGEMRLEARCQDLVPFLRGIARSFAPLAERRRVRFEVQAPDEPVPVSFDADKLEQVVTNLLSNAFKFTPEEGTILLSIRKNARTQNAAIAVRDSGEGIPADDQSHLFERFYQVDETSSTLQRGSGIGLSLAKDLVELHDGTITVESAVGLGSTFTVRLPLARKAERGRRKAEHESVEEETRRDTPPWLPAAEATLPAEETRRRAPNPPDDEQRTTNDQQPTTDRTTILIADDNAEIRAYVRGPLDSEYRVLEAADGADALKITRTALPDLIVSDVMMPKLDGFALVRALKKDPETDFIPVILLTAKATEEDKIEGLEDGADDYLTKPFNMRELQVRIDNLIASRRKFKERFAHVPPASTSPVFEQEGLSTSDAAFLDRVHSAVEVHLGDENFTVEQLAEEVEQSRSNLHRRLRQLLGQTPSAFIRRVRLERAARLLREHQEGTVSEVAYAVGFKSISHFSQSFRQRYGTSPSSYRNQRPIQTTGSRPTAVE